MLIDPLDIALTVLTGPLNNKQTNKATFLGTSQSYRKGMAAKDMHL